MALPEGNQNQGRTVVLVVPRAQVKTVKSVVEERGWFGRRIEKMVRGGGGGGDGGGDGGEFKIFTTLVLGEAEEEEALCRLGLEQHAGGIAVTFAAPADTPAATRNPLDAAIAAFIATHLPHLPASTISALLSTAPHRWSLYPPLALLPPTSFSSPSWAALLSALTPAQKHTLFSSITAALSTSHLAINAPILASSTIRAPTNLTPLHGDFGPPLDDIGNAFWCTSTQNGIFQTWAPRHTMFSRGNIKEKARVLRFPDVAGGEVADLYAGIGYFAFSYVAAGARRVWCWEVNPWSCEALLRGAGVNGWGVKLVHGEEEVGEVGEEVRLVVFMEDNVAALGRLRRLGVVGGVRGVRHVNLGLLPTSVGSWEAALGMVGEGGWVHVHENIAEGQIGEVAEGVVGKFRGMEKRGRTVRCEHVEQVKTFAPGVVHCVLDLRIDRENEVVM